MEQARKDRGEVSGNDRGEYLYYKVRAVSCPVARDVAVEKNAVCVASRRITRLGTARSS